MNIGFGTWCNMAVRNWFEVTIHRKSEMHASIVYTWETASATSHGEIVLKGSIGSVCGSVGSGYCGAKRCARRIWDMVGRLSE